MAYSMPIEPGGHLSGTRYFRLQLLMLGAGLGVLWLAHAIAAADTNPTRPDIGNSALVVLAAAMIGRASQVLAYSAFSESYRVFRARHLLGCSILLVATATVAVAPLLLHEPFARFFAYGRITGGEIADLGSIAGLMVCLVAAAVTAIGAWDARHDERHWYRALRSDLRKM